MNMLTVTDQGQIALGKDLLEHIGVRSGGKVIVNKLPNGTIEVKAARATGIISDVFGFLKRNDRPSLSIEAINEIAARGWAGKQSQ